MKTTSSTTIFLLLIPFFLLQSSSFGTCLAPSDDGEGTIILHQQNDDIIGAPRSSIPFYAWYDSSYVYVGSYANIGNVTIEVYSDVGDIIEVIFDTAQENILIPVSGLSGFYRLRITISSGDVYTGEFRLF